METVPHDAEELQRIYHARFESVVAYRKVVWKTLIANYFSRLIPQSSTVLDLGCGYGEFINQIPAARKFGMDLNPQTARNLAPDVTFLEQDCSSTWGIAANSLDVVFTSNFFEHLPDKRILSATLQEARRCLKPGGKLIAMGPNIKYTGGAYWDFYDHYLQLTELSLKEALELQNFEVISAIDRFLPYTMVNAPQYPIWMFSLYLSLPLAWKFFGKQFLVIASKP